MDARKRYLSKSRFKLGWECPTKLAYASDKSYGNTKSDNDFLKSLARGGFQVGALAQLYYPGGILIETLDTEEAVRLTEAELKKDNVTLFEAAIRYEGLLARVDVLVKRGNSIELIEVKSKSVNTEDGVRFLSTKIPGTLLAEWQPYLIDVAFQKLVLRRAFPELSCRAFLMLSDTSRRASVNGLNQRFFITEDERGRTQVLLNEVGSDLDLGDPILAKINVDAPIDAAWSAKYAGGRGFEEFVDWLAKAYATQTRISADPSKACRECEFRIPTEMKIEGLKSGWEECWGEAFRCSPDELAQPTVLDLSRFLRVDELLGQERIFLKDLDEADIAPKGKPKEGKEGLSNFDRQILQIQMVKDGATRPFIDLKGLGKALTRSKFPLHMIDFETSTVAVPFCKGMRPYETAAFQFSHHLIHEDGRIVHQSEYIDVEPGKFPNFDFVRALKRALGESGSIFRYSNHENTVLCQILRQLEDSVHYGDDPLTDRKELIEWIRWVTRSPQKAKAAWEGSRSMIDLCELASLFYQHPSTEGSNSLKYVLPAILSDSEGLQAKYSQPIYGTAGAGGIASHNFSNQIWIRRDSSGRVMDPYRLLEPLYGADEDFRLDRIFDGDEIREGGAAMTAYAQMQFTRMGAEERARLRSGLLRYCELDTFAMVLLHEYWVGLLMPE